jgi:hypothetical protein
MEDVAQTDIRFATSTPAGLYLSQTVLVRVTLDGSRRLLKATGQSTRPHLSDWRRRSERE